MFAELDILFGLAVYLENAMYPRTSDLSNGVLTQINNRPLASAVEVDLALSPDGRSPPSDSTGQAELEQKFLRRPLHRAEVPA